MWSCFDSSVMFRRGLTLALAMCVGAWMIVQAQSAPDAKELAEQARARAAATSVNVKSGVTVDRDHIRHVGERGMERGRIALDELIRQHEAKARGLAQTETMPGDPSELKDAPKGNPVLSGRLVVALSSSMPESMLREYVRQLDGIPEGIVVLRGFIGGARKVAPTGIWVESIRRKDVNCRACPHRAVQVVVDPLTYQSLGIVQVPAIAYLPGVQDLKHCDAETLQSSAVVYGAVSIASALKRLSREGVEIPDALLARMEKRT